MLVDDNAETELRHQMTLASMRDGSFPVPNIGGRVVIDDMVRILERLDGGCALLSDLIAETPPGDYGIRMVAIRQLRLRGLALYQHHKGGRVLMATEDADEWLATNGRQKPLF